jgi:type IV secretory pathway TrbD component
MIHSAVEQFLPATIVGVLLTGVLLLAAPKDLWMLPGLWQLIFSLGVFASCRFLPRQMFGVGVWYLASGLTCLMIESGPRVLSPWAMGIPFGAGQLLVAAVLRYGFEESLEER